MEIENKFDIQINDQREHLESIFNKLVFFLIRDKQ